MITQEQLAKNLFLCVADRSYKRDKLVVELSSPLSRDTLTGRVLLPMVLSCATEDYPNMVAISRRMDRLYGATLSTTSGIHGSRFLMRFDMDSPCDAYLPQGDVGMECARLLLDVILRPALQEDAFLPGVFQVERDKLAQQIRAQINNKREYCYRSLLSAFYGEDVRGLSSCGYEEDLPALSPQVLREIHKQMLRGSVAQVFYAGRHPEQIRALLKERFADCFAEGTPACETPAALPEKPVEQTIHMDVEQDKLTLLFHSGAAVDREDASALRVANCIFGASATSRLFTNVREKQSLCYYCSSSRSIVSGAMLAVESGVSAENAARAADAICFEMEKLASEGPTEKEMEEARLLFRNQLRGVGDGVGGYANYTLATIHSFGSPISQQQELELLEAVTAEDVRRILSSLTYCGSCRLTGEAQ